MSPKLALAFLLAASATLAKGQNTSTDSVRDSYHIFFPATGKDILAGHIGSHFYKMVNVDEKLSEVYVDDKRIADDDLTKYDAIIEKIRSSIRDDEEERDMRQMARDRRQRERDARQTERDREQQQKDREQRQRDQQARTETVEIACRNCDEVNRQNEQEQREQSAEDREMLKKGIQLLVTEHVINNPQHLKTLVLTDSDVSVNGVRQPQNIYQQMRSTLGDWALHGLSYGSDGPADNYSLSIND